MNARLMMIFLVLFSLLVSPSCFGQTNNVKHDSISPLELFGNWKNTSEDFKIFHSSKTIGQISNDKTIIPESDNRQHSLIKIYTDGRFIDLKYPKATWKLVRGFLLVRTEFGREIRGYLQRNDSTHVYRLTFEGETFYKSSNLEIRLEK